MNYDFHPEPPTNSNPMYYRLMDLARRVYQHATEQWTENAGVPDNAGWELETVEGFQTLTEQITAFITTHWDQFYPVPEKMKRTQRLDLMIQMTADKIIDAAKIMREKEKELNLTIFYLNGAIASLNPNDPEELEQIHEWELEIEDAEDQLELIYTEAEVLIANTERRMNKR